MNGTAAPSLSWFVARGSGFVAYLLLTAIIVLGIALSKRWRSEHWPRLVVEGMHRWLVIVFFGFIAIHTITVWVDPFTHFTLKDIAVPFGSAYRTVWLGMGVLATELLLAIGASVLVRRWIGYRVWHALHLFTYLLFPLSLLHGMGTGTDTQQSWATAIYVGSVVVVVGALIWRTMEERVLRRWVLSASAAGSVALAVWAVHGQDAPAWSQAAGTPTTLLAAAAKQRGIPTTASPAAPALPANISDTVSGVTIVGGEGRQLLLRGTGTGSAGLDVAMQLVQSREQIGGEVQLRTAAHVPLCAGPITGVQNGNTLIASCSGYGQQLRLQVTVMQLNASGFSASLRATG